MVEATTVGSPAPLAEIGLGPSSGGLVVCVALERL